MEDLRPEDSSDDLEDGGSFAENAIMKEIMKTPCRHYFHAICLQEWMKKKNQCPNCRERLPPKMERPNSKHTIN